MRLAGVLCERTYVWALGLLIALVTLTPLADASPPDPLWLAGVYDGADFDEVVVTIASATGLVGSSRLPEMLAAMSAAGRVRTHDTVLGAAAPSLAFSIRAPPSTTLIVAR
jgi:hypothetical protein